MSSHGKFHASELYKSSQQGKLQSHIEEIGKAIDDKIIDANKSGECEVVYPLPEYFDIQSLSRQDIQLVIYSRLIENFEKRGFDVSLTTNKPHLRVKWTNMLDDDEKERMKHIIKRHIH
jgi:hypothetical protein